MHDGTIHAFQAGRVDHRGLAHRRTISVREGDWRALYAVIETSVPTAFLQMRGRLQGVHTLGSLYLRILLLLFAKKLNSVAHEPKTAFSLSRRRHAPEKASWVFRGISVD